MKKRKQYKPKGINLNSAFDAINLSQPVKQLSREKLLADISIALLAFTQGVAVKSHFDVLASMVDVTMIADQSMFNLAYRDDIMEAREGMMRCRCRFAKT